MDDHALALFAAASKELQATATFELSKRAHRVARYPEKAAFYLAWLRWRPGPPRPALAIRHPTDRAAPPLAIPDLVRFKTAAPATTTWLSGYLLAQLRGLDYAGGDVPAGTTPKNDRVGHVLRQLHVDATAAAAARTDLGAAEFFALARYTVAERLRKLGTQLVGRKLVGVGAGRRLTWKPATDVFADPAFKFDGTWPGPGGKSEYPEAPKPGHLLGLVTPGAPPPLQGGGSRVAGQQGAGVVGGSGGNGGNGQDGGSGREGQAGQDVGGQEDGDGEDGQGGDAMEE